ncbi:MAG TPA: 50S ribosomal protein L4 [Candidatus Saccharimonadales bacterium]|jgi:large subunit ribosomal protein L4|nr:50S ribosomal protein L4 [Candidatus Saccharimonadales bacterium]
MNLSSYTKSGAVAKDKVSLDKFIFENQPDNHQLIKDNYVAYLSNSRDNLAVTKTRGLVSGGGRKPWKQKGTGQARAGSTRSPIWRSGGVTFGPTGEENYTHKTNKSAKRVALRQVLSIIAAEKKLIIIEDITFSGKTKDIAPLMKKIGALNKILLVVDTKTELSTRSTNNLAELKLVSAKYLNVFDLINADFVVITKPALEVVKTWLGEEK